MRFFKIDTANSLTEELAFQFSIPLKLNYSLFSIKNFN